VFYGRDSQWLQLNSIVKNMNEKRYFNSPIEMKYCDCFS